MKANGKNILEGRRASEKVLWWGKNRRESGGNELPEVNPLLTQDLSKGTKSDVILAVE